MHQTFLKTLSVVFKHQAPRNVLHCGGSRACPSGSRRYGQTFFLDMELGSNTRGDAEAIMNILRVITSAGGARPKAIIALDDNGHVMSN